MGLSVTDVTKADVEELVSEAQEHIEELKRAWEEDGHSFAYGSWRRLDTILRELGERELRKYLHARIIP